MVLFHSLFQFSNIQHVNVLRRQWYEQQQDLLHSKWVRSIKVEV